MTGPAVVATHNQVIEAGLRAEPPITDTKGFGFAWPDTQMGVTKTSMGYEFLTSDNEFHARQLWQGHWIGNNNYGSVVTMTGTLDAPLGSGDPQDESISPNPGPGVNHAETPSNTLYAVHGLAASWDNGLHWTDLGEVVRPNQSFADNLAPGFDEIGDGPLVLSPDANISTLFSRLACRHYDHIEGLGSARTGRFGPGRSVRVIATAHYSPLRSSMREPGICNPGSGERRLISIPAPHIMVSRCPLQWRARALCNDHFGRHPLRLRRIQRRSSLHVARNLRR